MNQDQLDRTLSGEAEIVPTSGFVSGVMAAVRREASAPPPIPFPWKRALPGLAAGALAFLMMIIVLVKNFRPAASTTTSSLQGRLLPILARVSDIGNMYGIGWVMLAILVTLGCVILSVRLTTGKWRTL
jgi:hypothetical protein